MTDLWTPDASTLGLWPSLTPGTGILVEKRDEFGDDGPIYPAVVARTTAPAPWIEVHATWTLKDIHIDGLAMIVGDEMREFFSPRHPYNAFVVISPEGELRGWYGNITRPTRCENRDGQLIIAWPDLILDVIALSDGTIFTRDEDELAETGLPDRDPELTRQIFAARDELSQLLRDGFFPVR